MTVVQPNSIAGINSISVQSGNALNLHKSDGTLIRTLVAESGISTYSSISVGSATTDNNAAKSINIGLGASISQHADNTLSFGTNGDERARITSTGELVIGATTSKAKFEVKDNGYTATSVIARLSADDSSPYPLVIANDTCSGTATNGMQFFVNNGGDHYIRCRGSSTAGNNNLLILSQNDMRFSSGASETERLRITSAGDVGISTLTPASKLHLYDAASDGLIVQSPSGLHYVWAIQASGNLNNGSLAGELGIRAQSGLSISANGGTSTQLRLDSSGRLLLGATSDVAPDSFGSLLQIDSGSSAGSIALGRHTASGSGPALLFHKSRSGSGSGATIVQDGDNLGTIRFYGADGTDRNSYGANISANVDGTPGSNDLPGNLIFSTTADGAASPTERLRIKSDGNITAVGIVTAKSFVPTQYQLGNRNILYNGAMQVNQYATQVTGLSNYNSYPTCDRWRCIISNGGTYTVESTTEGPADTGFNKALRFTCTTADNAGQPNLANADGYVAIEQRLEGFDVQGIQKGTTSAKTLTLSFWCKSNLTGTYNIELFDQDNQRRVGFQYTVSSSGSWEKKTFNFPAETNSSYPLGNDNGDSLRLRWFLAAGNNWRTGTNSGSWAANTTNQRAQSNVNLSTATSNYFALTGVQLEVGDHATPFEWIKFGDELKRCQRYYQKIGTGNFGDYSLGTGYVYNNGNNLALGVYLACPLRASPTVAVTGNMNVRYPAGGNNEVDVNSPNVPSNHDPYCHWLPIGWGITSDIGSNGELASLNNTNNNGVTLSAEL